MAEKTAAQPEYVRWLENQGFDENSQKRRNALMKHELSHRTRQSEFRTKGRI